MNEEESCVDFRFKKNEILALARVLNLPGKFTCNQGTVCESIEALCIVLRRFAYPCRFSDLVPQFGQPVPELSMITNTVVDFIFQNHGEKLTTWNHALLNPQSLRLYADAIHPKRAALENCFGFVDGTVRQICRPGQRQRIVYNGRNRVHALKFQSVVIPNRIIANMFGPIGMHFLHLCYTLVKKCSEFAKHECRTFFAAALNFFQGLVTKLIFEMCTTLQHRDYE